MHGPVQATEAAATEAAAFSSNLDSFAPAIQPLDAAPAAAAPAAAAAATPSPSSASAAAVATQSSASTSATNSQAKLARVLVHVPGVSKPVRVAAESIEELRRELGESVDDPDVLSEDVLASATFSLLPPTAAALSPTPLTDDALWSLEKNTPLFLSWTWCAVTFRIQSVLNASLTRQSMCLLCGSKLSHPKHDKPE